MSVTRRVATAATAAVLLAACQTGERPSLDASPTVSSGSQEPVETTADPITSEAPVTDRRPGVIADLFDTSAPVTETAVYHILQSAQRVSATVTVSRTPGRTVIDVRGTQFRDDAGSRQTCNDDTHVCAPDFAEQELSDLQITTSFWGPAVQRELESPTLSTRIGPVTTSSETIAGQPATCVSIPGPNRSDRYCALDSGLLASKVTAAVTIDLVEYHDSFDETLWNKVPG